MTARAGVGQLRRGLTEREEKNSVAIASNESFGGWTKTFTDPHLCTAIVDRLTFGGNIIETGTDSYRLARTEPSPPPEPAPPDVTIHEHRSCSKRSTDAEIHEQTTPPLTDIAKHPIDSRQGSLENRGSR